MINMGYAYFNQSEAFVVCKEFNRLSRPKIYQTLNIYVVLIAKEEKCVEKP